MELLNTNTSTTTSSSAPSALKKSPTKLPLKKRRHVKKSVGWSLHKNQVKTRHASDEDLMRAWHQREDYHSMEMSAKKSVMEAIVTMQLTQKEPEGFTTRGLEATICQKIREQRKQWIGTTVGGVLLVQGLQKAIGVYDPEILRGMSLKGSETARICGAMVGALDAKEAM